MLKRIINQYPRVLIVNGEPFWSGSATGLTMSSLFRGWPKDSLACLYLSPIDPDWTICERYWRLQVRDLRCVGAVLGEPDPIVVTPPTNMELPSQTPTNSSSANRSKLKQWRRRLAGQSVRDLDVYKMPEHILKAVADYQPQVIYSMLGSNPILQLVIDMADQFEIPVVPHFMDDWPMTLYKGSVFRKSLRKVMKTRLEAILKISSIRLVIGDAMMNAYASRYGGDFVPFMNAVEPDLLEQPIVIPEPRQKIKLIYVGGLHLNRWQSLRDIGLALNLLWLEGIETEAYIYTHPRFAQEANKLNIPPAMRFAGSLTPEEVPHALRDADIVLHIESFDLSILPFIQYSVSTKIPESMCSARPIFAYGPRELASIRYIHDAKVGLAVGVQSQDAVVNALRTLITSPLLRQEFGRNGHFVVNQKHNATIHRKRFRSIIEQSVVDYAHIASLN